MIENKNKIEEYIHLFELEQVLNRHPFDLSGGEEERLGISKVLLTKGDILLLDEPTKGLDGAFKKKLERLLNKLKEEGKTVLLVTHDMEFSANVATRCGMLFEGQILADNPCREFFLHNQFYTTDMVRVTKGIIPNIVTFEDYIKRCQR